MQAEETEIQAQARKLAEEMEIIPIKTQVVCTGTFNGQGFSTFSALTHIKQTWGERKGRRESASARPTR